MDDQMRATVPVPEGMRELAKENFRSLGQEAKVAMIAHLRKYKGNSRQRRNFRRKHDRT